MVRASPAANLWGPQSGLGATLRISGSPHPPACARASARLHANVHTLHQTPEMWSFHSPPAVAGDRKRSHFLLIRMQMWGIKFACWAELIPATPSACAVSTNYRQASDGRLKPWILSGGVFYLRGGIPIRPTGQTERYCSSIAMCRICRHFQRDINSLLSLLYLSVPVASLCGSYRRLRCCG